MVNTHILLSFGGIDGGFEFTWQLRNDLMAYYGYNPFNAGSPSAFFVYLDAVSLMGWHGSLYNWDASIYCYKFSNKDWEKYYKAATEQCRYMVFVLTAPWFLSQWCWAEYTQFTTVAQENPDKAKAIFIVFPDAKAILDKGGTCKDRINQEHDVGALATYIGQNTAIPIAEMPVEDALAINTVSIQGTDYKYRYKYSCSLTERAEIMAQFTDAQRPKL